MISNKFCLVLTILMISTFTACKSTLPSGAYKNQESLNITQLNSNRVVPTTIDELKNDSNSLFAKRSVYFDFDSYSVRDKYQPMLLLHAQYLRTHPECHLLIQGNTDERGTSEYNLALGQKRAEAIRRLLLLLGVSDSQIEAVSLGKEKPVAQGHNETSWSQNRRSDLVYQ